MRILSDSQVQTIINALCNSRNDCKTVARKVRNTPAPTGEHKARYEREALAFDQSAAQYDAVLSVVENAFNVVVDLRKGETIR